MAESTRFERARTSTLDVAYEVSGPDNGTPVVLVPCCNFWDRTTKLGRDELLDAIAAFYREAGVRYDLVELDFSGPHNRCFATEPPE